MKPILKRKRIRGKFWRYVHSFWNCHGGCDMDGEWTRGVGFYRDLHCDNRYAQMPFKNIHYNYRLELYPRKYEYVLSVKLCLSSYQTHMIEKVFVKSKFEAIKATIQIIKDFESKKENNKIVTNLYFRNPIIKYNQHTDIADVVAINFVGSVEHSLYRSMSFNSVTHPLGTGVFFSLTNKKEYWRKYDINGCGYCSQGCKNEDVPIKVKEALEFYTNILKPIVIKKWALLNMKDKI